MVARRVNLRFPSVVLPWLVLAAAALPGRAAERSVEIWVGESASISAGRKQVERGTVTVTSDKPKIATATWGGGDTGPVIINGVSEGEAVVTVKGKVRVISFGIKRNGEKAAFLRNEDFTDYVNVTVVEAETEQRVVMIHKRQRMTLSLGKTGRIRTIQNGDDAVIRVHRNTLSTFTIIGKREGFSLVTVKFTRMEKGKKKNITGLVYVTVYGGKREGPRTIRMGWDAMPEPTHRIIIIDPEESAGSKKSKKPEKKVSQVPAWPGIEGVHCTFVPSGRNYGDIGDFVIKNATDEPVTVTVPPGMLLDSSDGAVQDLYVADVPTETPCAGADDIGKPITIQPEAYRIIQDVPGFCPDFEKEPPGKDDTSVYACRQPDEKSKVLLDTIESVKKLDVGALKLDVFGKDKARAMVAQGSLWMVDSEIDEEKGNEVAGEDLSDKFYETFASAAKGSLDRMSPDNRKQAEKLVKDDIKKIVQATSFVAKQSTKGKTA